MLPPQRRRYEKPKVLYKTDNINNSMPIFTYMKQVDKMIFTVVKTRKTILRITLPSCRKIGNPLKFVGQVISWLEAPGTPRPAPRAVVCTVPSLFLSPVSRPSGCFTRLTFSYCPGRHLCLSYISSSIRFFYMPLPS